MIYARYAIDTRYRVSAGAVYKLKYHFVWCPKYRKPVLVGKVDKRLRELLYQKAKEREAEIHALEIMPDHVHLFVESDPRLAPAHIAAPVKHASAARQCERLSPTESTFALRVV